MTDLRESYCHDSWAHNIQYSVHQRHDKARHCRTKWQQWRLYRTYFFSHNSGLTWYMLLMIMSLWKQNHLKFISGLQITIPVGPTFWLSEEDSVSVSVTERIWHTLLSYKTPSQYTFSLLLPSDCNAWLHQAPAERDTVDRFCNTHMQCRGKYFFLLCHSIPGN